MKRFLCILIPLVLIFCFPVSAAGPADTPLCINGIPLPEAGKKVEFYTPELRDYTILAQIWVEYTDGSLTGIACDAVDSFYTEAYAALPEFTEFQSGATYDYAMVLSNKERVAFTEDLTVYLCGTELTATVDKTNPMCCILEASFVCGESVSDTVDIFVDAPVVNAVPDVSGTVSDGFVCRLQYWTSPTQAISNDEAYNDALSEQGLSRMEHFSDYQSYTYHFAFSKADSSDFEAIPTVRVNGLVPDSVTLSQSNVCSVSITFPYELVVEDFTVPTAGEAPEFSRTLQYGPYSVFYQQWQEFTPGGFLGRVCVLDENGDIVENGTEPLLTEYVPGLTYDLHFDICTLDGTAMTNALPLIIGGRTAYSRNYKDNVVSDTAFTVPFSFEVAAPIAGTAPSYSGFTSDYYVITEAWMQLDEDGNIVKFISNDAELNADFPLSKRLLKFQEGVTYTYAVNVTTEALYSLRFAPNAYVNGELMHMGLYSSSTVLGYEKSFSCPTVDESIEIRHSLNLASDISINFAVAQSALAEYDSFYLECVIPEYEGNTLTGSQTVTLSPVSNGDYYYFTLNGVTAVSMSNTIESTLYMSKDGATYVSDVDTYSIASYAYSQLEKDTASETLKALCAELLRYGSAAQTFKGYRTDSLADASMTETQKAYLCDLSTVSFGNNNAVLDDIPAPSVTWAGKTLDLTAKVTLKFILDASSYSGDLSDLSLHVSYKDYTGAEQTAVIFEIEEYNASNCRYAFPFDGLLAAELRQVVSVAVYEGDVQLSPTIQYSADTYGNNKTGSLLTVCQALMAYSDAALLYTNSR